MLVCVLENHISQVSLPPLSNYPPNPQQIESGHFTSALNSTISYHICTLFYYYKIVPLKGRAGGTLLTKSFHDSFWNHPLKHSSIPRIICRLYPDYSPTQYATIISGSYLHISIYSSIPRTICWLHPHYSPAHNAPIIFGSYLHISLSTRWLHSHLSVKESKWEVVLKPKFQKPLL